MPSKPHAEPLRKAPLLFASAAAALMAAMLTSCASSDGRLVTAVPAGVDLSGEWRLNENLSDDPQHIDEPKGDLPPQAPSPGRSPGGFGRPGSTIPGSPSGPGGIDPGGPGEDITRAATQASGFVPVRYEQDSGLPPSASDSGPPAKPPGSGGREGGVSHMLDMPQHLSITQTGGKLVVKSDSGAAEEYTAGEQHTIPFGRTEADRSAGWRESAFVVITKAKKGPSKEDDYALDDEGHLIFATLVTHVKKGPIDFKRVYDRVRTPH